MVRPTKTVSKLTVLPPLNLPSLRKEHEKYDASGRSGGLGVGGVGGLGSGSRPSSTRVGWTKLVPDKNGLGAGNTGGGVDSTDGVRPGSDSYGSRSTSSGAGEVSSSATRDALPSLEKAVVLRGEEFPSLQAARSTSSGTSRKEKIGFNEKQKQVISEELTMKKKDDHHLDPQGQSSHNAGKSGLVDAENETRGVGGGRMATHNQKQQEYFPDPLPLVQLNPRSDWADDERDTSYRFVERERDVGYSKSESYWDRDFDFPRTSLLPQKPVRHQYERWGSQDYEAGNNLEVLVADASRKDYRGPSQGGSEGNRWGTSQSVNDGISASSRATGHVNALSYNKYSGSGNVVSGSDGSFLQKQDSRGDFGFGERKQFWNNSAESNYNRGVEHNYRNHIAEQPTRYKGDNFQNNKSFKSATVSGRNMAPTNEAVSAAVRDKRFSKDDRYLLADPFVADFDSDGFDGRDFFSGGSLGLLKRKKDAAKPTEFHDPVRESFEAELERIQRMQELERLRIVEEQEKALEKARREDEERQKRIREEEERQRLLEEEAREAAWRAEKEKQEAIQRSEEQRIAREEERRRMLMEEERRKQAAKQKLLELEAKIAMREAEASKAGASVASTLLNNKLQDTVKDKCNSGDRDLDTWEDEERMLGNVMTASSSIYQKPIEVNSRYSLALEGSSNALERERVGASFPSPLLDHEIGHYRPNWEAYNSGRMVPRKEPIGKSTYTSSKFYGKEEIRDRRSGVLGYHNEHLWSLSGNVDLYEGHKDRESEVHDGLGSMYDDIGWDQGRLESSVRSRYSMRQPRVLPPPLAPVQRSPSTFLDNETRSESTQQTIHHSTEQGDPEPSEVLGLQREPIITEELKPNLITRCDSQSSLVVSSPPNSPPHLSEEEFDETVDLSTSDMACEERNLLKIGSDVLDENHGKDKMSALGSMSALDDEDWPIDNDNKLQRPDEYDEEEDNYREEDDACDHENLGLSKKFEELDIEDRLILGFNEGSKVIIPSDDLAENLGADEMAFVIPESSAGIAELVESVLPYENDSATNANGPSVKIAETGLVSQGSTGQSVSSYSEPDILEGHSTSGSAGLPVQHSDPFPGYAKNFISQNTMDSTSSAKSLVDFPLNLQFGLFPGPSLPPTSVSAIQIGSLQIPIHDHHHASPAFTHTEPSQPSMFQFGQLRFTAPVSHGISPAIHKSTSSVHPAVQGQVSVNDVAGGPVSQETGQDAFLPNLTKEKEQPNPGFFNDIDGKFKSELVSSLEEKLQQNSVLGSSLPSASEGRAVTQFQRVPRGFRSAFGEKHFSGHRGGMNGRGRRFTYAVKGANPGSSSLFQAHSNEFQRKPRQTYWTRDRSYSRHAYQMDHPADTNLDKSKFMGKARNGIKKTIVTNKRMREKIDVETVNSDNIITQGVDSGDALPQKMAKKLPTNSEKTSRDIETSLGRKFYEEDVDAALQSGIVCVFRQPGIEAPSDEDDFIEVRSKRHLHDQRKQREKETKEQLRTRMQPRKPQASRQMAAVSRNHNKLHVPLSNEISSNSNLNVAALQNHQLPKKEVRTGITSVVSQNPRAASAMNSGVQSTKTNHAKSTPVISLDRPDGETGAMSESRNKAMEHDQSSVTHWSMEGIGQQVMSLTQTQLDEAMKPAPFDPNISNIGSHSSIKSDQILPTPIFAKDKSFTSGASAVSSLLAGEKIQFGALTSPAVLPPNNNVASDEIGAPGSNWSDVQIAHNIPESKIDGTLIFGNDVHSGDLCSLTDPKAEVKRDSSAVDVANLNEKEVVADKLSSATAPDAKISDGASIDGVVGDRQAAASQSRGDDSLTASLPADLSVETTQLSLWPPLPSPQNDSSQLLSHFPEGPPSHFPFYDMNRLLGGPIFDSGSLEESSGTQSQQPTSTSTTSVPPVNWQHHSFYGPPMGYPGPFMSPIGVQGPQHMVLYDHFAPVGQFGQVGLSLMGPSYYPHGQQSDWKHNPASSAMHGGEGNIYNGNMAHLQSNAPPNSLAPIHHLAPGSPLMSAPSPLPVFDVAPFQPQAGILPFQVSRGHPTVHRSSPVSMFPEQPQIPGQLGGNNGSSVSTTIDTVITPFSAELGLIDSLPSTKVSSGQGVSVQISSGSTNVESGNSEKSQNPSSSKTWLSQKDTTSHNGYNNHQRVGMYQRNNAGNDWSNRRSGFHGRKQSFGADKVFPASKMKQIYVPKQTNSGNSDK